MEAKTKFFFSFFLLFFNRFFLPWSDFFIIWMIKWWIFYFNNSKFEIKKERGCRIFRSFTTRQLNVSKFEIQKERDVKIYQSFTTRQLYISKSLITLQDDINADFRCGICNITLIGCQKRAKSMKFFDIPSTLYCKFLKKFSPFLKLWTIPDFVAKFWIY